MKTCYPTTLLQQVVRMELNGTLIFLRMEILILSMGMRRLESETTIIHQMSDFVDKTPLSIRDLYLMQIRMNCFTKIHELYRFK